MDKNSERTEKGYYRCMIQDKILYDAITIKYAKYITYSISVRTLIDRPFTTYVIKHVTFFQSTSRIHHNNKHGNAEHGPAFCSFFYSMNESSNGTLLFQVNMK